MKRPTFTINQPGQVLSRRADVPPETGFAIVVDGHVKTEFGTEEAAHRAAKMLLDKNPRLRVEVYDGAKKTCTRVWDIS